MLLWKSTGTLITGLSLVDSSNPVLCYSIDECLDALGCPRHTLDMPFQLDMPTDSISQCAANCLVDMTDRIHCSY